MGKGLWSYGFLTTPLRRDVSLRKDGLIRVVAQQWGGGLPSTNKNSGEDLRHYGDFTLMMRLTAGHWGKVSGQF